MKNNDLLPHNAEKRRKLITAGYWACGILFGIIALCALYHTLSRTSARIMRDFMSPFLSVTARITTAQADMKLLSQSKLRLAEAVIRLEKRNLELEAQSAGINMIMEENRQLRSLMNMKPLQNFQPVMAAVTTRNADAWHQKFMIDAGSEQGISIGDLVVASAPDNRIAVAGRICEVSRHTAVVTTCYSDDFKLSVAVGPAWENGVLEYDPAFLYPRVRYLPLTSTVKEGDLVQTSGIPRRTPGGIPLGRIVRGGNGKAVVVCDKLFTDAFIRPMIIPDIIRIVAVYTQKQEKK